MIETPALPMRTRQRRHVAPIGPNLRQKSNGYGIYSKYVRDRCVLSGMMLTSITSQSTGLSRRKPKRPFSTQVECHAQLTPSSGSGDMHSSVPLMTKSACTGTEGNEKSLHYE
jgi:hypothetical protein